MRKNLLLTLILSSVSLYVIAQDFSNKGKDFWVAYGYHQIMNAGNVQNMVLYFATDQVTTITVTVPGTGYTQTLTSGPLPTVLTSAPIPKAGAQDARLTTESLSPENKGIHVVSDKPIVAYAHIYNASVSGASILFPTNTLGKEYYSVNYKNISNTSNSNCWMYVVAADTGTTIVEITPSVTTLHHASGVPFFVTLTQGQVYNVMATFNTTGNPLVGGDLTGSKIRSISSGLVGCKRIAVFSGSGRISITCDGSSSSSDNYMVQAFPKNAWGKKYLTASAAGNQSNNIYRICVADPATIVTVNGAPVSVPLINNFYYEIPATSNPQKIESDQPILVSQYFTSQGACGNGATPGDPEVLYLSAVEQSISTVLWNATPNFGINQHYFNVIIPNGGTALSSFKLDGVAVNPTLFTVHPQDPAYSYMKKNVLSGSHRIESDSGFNAIAYGFGAAESYGYNAGTNVKDLYQKIGVKSLYGIESTPSVCLGSPFKFKISLPYQPDSMYWDFHNPATVPAIANAFMNSPSPLVFDSVTVINTKTVWWYSLPTYYTFNTLGNFPITITTYRQNTEGCGNVQEIEFTLEVSDPPVANFNWSNTICDGETVQFNDASISVKPTYHWWWDFGDPASGAANSSAVKNPAHQFSGPGTYIVRYSNITTPGCLSDTITKQIIVYPRPMAALSGNASVCLNGTAPLITFTGANGTAPYTFTYKINGGPNQTIVTTSGNAVTLPVSTSTVATYTYTLVSVADASPTFCSQPQTGTAAVTVNPLPTGNLTGTTTVCLNATAPVITFTGASGTSPYTFTYHINSGPDQTVTTTTGNAVTVAAPANTAGTFVYTLTNVQGGSSTACSLVQNGTATVIVNSLPTALVSGTTEVCLNGTPPTVTFTGAGTVAPYTFTYKINGGPNLTATTVTGNSVTVTAPVNIAGTFTYTLVSVRDGSAQLCSQAQTGAAVITVNPLPVPGFTFSLPLCESKTISFSDASVPNAGAVNQWTWSFGDPASGPLNTSTLQNPVHVYNTPGIYPATLSITTDKGCASVVPFNGNVVINYKPAAGFIDPEVCLTDTWAQFTDTSRVTGGTVTGWNWNFGDPGSGTQNTSTLQNPQHSYNSVGPKTVTLISTSNFGCKDTIVRSFIVNGDIPVANFTVNNAAALCANDTVSIVNNSTVNVGSIIKVEVYWDNVGAPTVFDTDLDPAIDKVYKHLYPNSQVTKNYTIRYRVYSGATCIDDRFQTIAVNAAPKVQFNTIPDACLNTAPFQITQATELGTVPGTYVFSGPGITASGMFDPIAVGPGTYTLHYVYTSDFGCRDSATQQIRVLQAPVAAFAVGSPACEEQMLSFTDASSPTVGTLTTWTWDFGDATPPEVRSSGASFTHTFADAGSYNVKLVVTTNDGCKSTAKQLTVSVAPKPVPDFSFPAVSCLPNAAVQFTGLSAIADGTELGFTYVWDFGDPATLNTSLSKDPIHIYTATGIYPVKLQVRSAAGCVQEVTKMLNTIHPQPSADFDFSKPRVCIGDEVIFHNLSDPADGTTVSWHWDFGDNRTATIQDPPHTYQNIGTYPVKLFIVNSLGCNSDTMEKDFNVYPYPVVDAGPPLFVLEDGTVVLHPTVTGNDLTYLWTPPLYLNNNTLAAPTSTPRNDITYTLVVTARGGCQASDNVFLKVLLGPQIPNTFSPNNDGINDAWEIKYLYTYPNNRVQVFTKTGQLIFASKGYIKPWDGTFKGKSLPMDTYYYIIEPENGRKPLTGYVTILK
jgi:gliding motility-associated-like protein